MGYLTKVGTLWGEVPRTPGRVWWVAPVSPYTVDGRAYSSSDNNDGLSPERALATIAQALLNATSDVGDVIMLLNSATAHTSAATITLSKSGLTFVGCHPQTRISPNVRNHPGASKVNWTSTFAGVGITNTGADNTFIGINFIPVTAQSMMTLSGSSRNTFIDCALTMSAAASTSTKGFVMSGTNNLVSFTNCLFLNTIGAQGPCIDFTGATGFVLEKSLIINTTGSWAVAVQLGAGSTGAIRDNEFVNKGTAITIGVDGTGVAVAASIAATRNYAGVSPGAGTFKNFTNSYCELNSNYMATVGGGTGQTLITTVV